MNSKAVLHLAATIREKQLHRWLGGYARHLVSRTLAPAPDGVRHLLFAICDHYEPLWGNVDRDVGRARVRAWSDEYPRLGEEFSDADGRPPRHSFFFPGEEYAPEYLDALAELAARDLGEVELHLHHDRDDRERLREKIVSYLESYAGHGHLSRASDGKLRYAFIHGNWCLANARDDGRWCGVDDEIPLLFETGCYADFTFPSAPDSCQPNIVNRIYWPSGDLTRRRAYEQGEPARVGHVKDDRILMIQGPLALARRPGSFKMRIEGAALTANDPPTASRVKSWVDRQITVEGRPEWVFVKVHTHGAPERQAAALLGEPIRELHRVLGNEYNDGTTWRLHYVTAREMFNIAMAAIHGQGGDPNVYRDYILPPPPVAARAAKSKALRNDTDASRRGSSGFSGQSAPQPVSLAAPDLASPRPATVEPDPGVG
jgi:hypothetical protein